VGKHVAGGISAAEFKKYTAEAIGAFILTFAGITSIVSFSSMFSGLGGGFTFVELTAIAGAHGGALALAVYAFGPISGAHVNPAISASLFIQKKLSQRDFLFYVVFQVVGATVAALLVAISFPYAWVHAVHNGATLGTMNPTYPGSALVVEIMLTFFLATAVGIVVRGGEKMANLSGFLIGGTLFFCILAGGTLTGASLNPARSTGPAIASGTDSLVWGSLWIYWVGPLIGGLMAGFMTMWFRGEMTIHLATHSSAQNPGLPPPTAQGGLPAPPAQPPLPAPIMSPSTGEQPKSPI